MQFLARWRLRRRQLGRRIIWRLAEERVIQGISVRVALQFRGEEPSDYLDEIERALELLARSDPRWLARGREASRGIAVWDGIVLGSAGTFNRLDRIVSFQPEFVVGPRTNTHLLASFILHEFVHAWTHHRGLDHPRHQLRIERLCHLIQFAGAKRLNCDPETLRVVSHYLDDVDVTFDAGSQLRTWIDDAEKWQVPAWYRRLFLTGKVRRARRRLARLEGERHDAGAGEADAL